MWELGVLRAIGMTNTDILKLSIYESLSNNLSSVILGLLIGLLISICMVSQFLIFLELPFQLIVILLFITPIATLQDIYCCDSIEYYDLDFRIVLCNKDTL